MVSSKSNGCFNTFNQNSGINNKIDSQVEFERKNLHTPKGFHIEDGSEPHIVQNPNLRIENFDQNRLNMISDPDIHDM